MVTILASVCLCPTAADTQVHTAALNTTISECREARTLRSAVMPAACQAHQRRCSSSPQKNITIVIVVIGVTIIADTVVTTDIDRRDVDEHLTNYSLRSAIGKSVMIDGN